MPLTVCKKHSKKTIYGIYSELTKDDESSVWRDKAQAMLKIVELIDELFVETKIYGITSHYRLGLLSEDRWDARWHVIIDSISNWYDFNFAVPESKCPWPDARMTGSVVSNGEVKKYLLIAMRDSGGWEGNDELKRLLVQNGLAENPQ